MDNSFTPLDRLLKLREAMDQDFPYKEILLTRLCIHMQGKLLEKGNDSNLLIVFYVQIMPDDFVMQLHRF